MFFVAMCHIADEYAINMRESAKFREFVAIFAIKVNRFSYKPLSLMEKSLKDIAYFLSFCIEQYMNEKGQNEDEVISKFSEYGVFDYLKDYFDILHTQSRQWLVAEIDEFINSRK